MGPSQYQVAFLVASCNICPATYNAWVYNCSEYMVETTFLEEQEMLGGSMDLVIARKARASLDDGKVAESVSYDMQSALSSDSIPETSGGQEIASRLPPEGIAIEQQAKGLSLYCSSLLHVHLYIHVPLKWIMAIFDTTTSTQC